MVPPCRQRGERVAPADLNAIMIRASELVRHEVEMASIQLVMDLDPQFPLVHCDAGQIEQAVLALVMNALGAMPKGGTLRLASRFVPSMAEVRLQVQDDGSGIAPEALPHLFEPFFTTKEIGEDVAIEQVGEATRALIRSLSTSSPPRQRTSSSAGKNPGRGNQSTDARGPHQRKSRPPGSLSGG